MMFAVLEEIYSFYKSLDRFMKLIMRVYITNAYLQKMIEPQDGLEFVKCASVEAWKDLPHFL